MMTYRQRLLNTLRGDPVDRLPFVETATNPYQLVRTYSDWNEHIPADEDPRVVFGFDDASAPTWHARVPLDPYAVPRFPDRPLPPDGRYPRVLCREWGCVAKHRPPDEADPFPKRVFEDYVVNSEDDWRMVRDRHFALDTAGRFPGEWASWGTHPAEGSGPVLLDIPAPESGLWGLLGEEGEASILTGPHCCPSLIREMTEHLSELYLMCIEKALAEKEVDIAVVCGSDLWTLVGPRVMDEFFFPFHARAIELVRSHGVDLVCLSTRVAMATEWLDRFVEAGVSGIRMVEETGNGHRVRDVIDRYGDELFYIGMLDGRLLTGDRDTIDSEVRRGVRAAGKLRAVPSLHGDCVVPSVPFRNYEHYVACLRSEIFGMKVDQ